MTLRGWLVSGMRRERREQPETLTDKQVDSLIKKIEGMPKYTRLDAEYDRLLRLRDKALIATAWTWFKRGHEDLNLKMRDVYWDEGEIVVTFRVGKKSKRYRICPKCGLRNGIKASFCRDCGENLQGVEVEVVEMGERVSTKRKSMRWPFAKYIVEWLKELRKMEVPSDASIFPPFKFFTGTFQWHKSERVKKRTEGITVQRFDQILQRLDPTLTSSHFRYGHTEKLFRLGYTPLEAKEIGDWEKIDMPLIYAKRKGLTFSEKKFTEDIRTL